jgi:hypothetical protein
VLSSTTDIDSYRDYLSLQSGRTFPDVASGICITFYAIFTAAITTIETISIPFVFDVRLLFTYFSISLILYNLNYNYYLYFLVFLFVFLLIFNIAFSKYITYRQRKCVFIFCRCGYILWAFTVCSTSSTSLYKCE